MRSFRWTTPARPLARASGDDSGAGARSGAGGWWRARSCSRSRPGSRSARARSAAARATRQARAVDDDRRDAAPKPAGEPRAGAARDPRRPRDDGARLAAREAAAVPGAAGPEHGRARRQGRERQGRLRSLAPSRSPGAPARPAPYYKAKWAAQARAREGRLPDRPRRHLRGPRALGAAAGPGDPHERRLALADERRASAGRTRTTGGSGSTTSTSPWPRRRPASTRSSSTTCASRATATSRSFATPASTRSRCRGRSRPSSSTRGSGCTRSARASRSTSSGSRPRTTSASARCRAASRATWTRSTRWSTPRTTTPASTTCSDPNAVPGETVTHSLLDFQTALEGRKARLTPWLQDFSLGRTYTLGDVQAQVQAARSLHAHGFLLWNAEGLYDGAALAAACMSVMQVCIRPAAAVSSPAWR